MIQQITLAIFIVLLIIRPFICSLAYPRVDFFFSLIFITTCAILLRKKYKDIIFNTPSRWAMSFFCVCTISVFLSQNVLLSLFQFHKYGTYFFAFLVAYQLKNEEKQNILFFIPIGTALMCIISLQWHIEILPHLLGFWQKFSPQTSFLTEFLSRGRLFFPFFSPNVFAGYLLLQMTLPFYFLINRDTIKTSKLTRPFWFFVTFFIGLTFFLTQSLGAFLALATALLISILFWTKPGAGKKRLLLLILVLLLGSHLILLLTRNSNAYNFNSPLFSILKRFSYWKEAIGHIGQHPLKGFGIGNYQGCLTTFAHNTYLQLWVEGGIACLITFLGFVFTMLRLNHSQLDLKRRAFLRILWIPTLALLLHNIFDFTFFLPEVALLWWVFAGLLCSPHQATDTKN